MLNEYLSDDKRVYWDYLLPHKDFFELYWDNDVISLSKKDAQALIPKLILWLNKEYEVVKINV